MIFGILDTSQIVKMVNAFCSLDLTHNCVHSTYNVDCCYDILEHLLITRMLIKTYIRFQVIYYTNSQIFKVIYNC